MHFMTAQSRKTNTSLYRFTFPSPVYIVPLRFKTHSQVFTYSTLYTIPGVLPVSTTFSFIHSLLVYILPLYPTTSSLKILLFLVFKPLPFTGILTFPKHTSTLYQNFFPLRAGTFYSLLTASNL